MKEPDSLAQWLEEKRREGHLSLRQVAIMTGLSHSTIADILRGICPTAGTIKKLARGFSKGGINQTMALEDYLLALAGHRTKQEHISQPLAELLDTIDGFSPSLLKVMSAFAAHIKDK